jgi:SAM-dependent methyltransferase
MNFKDYFLQNDKHLADKWETYLDVYSRLFVPYEDKPVRILEIGVFNGGTLDVLAAYFKNATEIIGVDIDPKCGELVFTDPHIRVVVADIKEAEIDGDFDVIIDDGSHICNDVIKTFAAYFPRLNCGGLYIIEDLHTSYWHSFGGGLHTPASSMSFLKRLIDYINQEHWRVSANPIGHVEDLYNVSFTGLDEIHSIEFSNSLCVIRKGEDNTLGERILSGVEESIAPGWKEHNVGTHIYNIPATVKRDEQYDQFNMIEMVNYLKEQAD